MAGVTITAKVRRDGALAISKAARERLGLHEGDKIQITLDRPGILLSQPVEDPLLELIGIGKDGPVNGAQDHDEALYGRSSD